MALLPFPTPLDLPTTNAPLGAPFHGTVIDNNLDLTGSGGPDLTLSCLQTSGFILTLSNPNRTLPTRSAGEITSDATVGRVFRSYALTPGRRVYGSALFTISSTEFIYFDSRGYTWKGTIDLDWLHATAVLDGSVTMDAFAHVGDLFSPTQVVKSSLSLAAGTTGSGTGNTNTAIVVMDQKEDGSRVLLGTSSSVVGLHKGFWELTISDTPDETGGSYPYGGGTIDFTIGLNVTRAPTDMCGAVTYTSEVNTTTKDLNGNVPGTSSPAGLHSSAADETIDLRFSFTARHIWANYDQAGNIEQWSVDFSGDSEKFYTFTPTGPTDPATMHMDHDETVDIVLKQNGTAVQTEQYTMTRDYDASADFGDLPSGVDWDSDVTITGPGHTNKTGTHSETGTNGGILEEHFNADPSILFLAGLNGVAAAQGIAGGGARTGLNPFTPLTAQSGRIGYFWEIDSGGNSFAFEPRLDNKDGNKMIEFSSVNNHVTKSFASGLLQHGSDGWSQTEFEFAGVKVFAPDSSHTPDTTVREVDPAGPIAAYNPETNTWISAVWQTTAFDVRHIV